MMKTIFSYFIKTVLIRILTLVLPSWSTALYMAVLCGIDQIRTGLTDELNLTDRVVIFHPIQHMLEAF